MQLPEKSAPVPMNSGVAARAHTTGGPRSAAEQDNRATGQSACQTKKADRMKRPSPVITQRNENGRETLGVCAAQTLACEFHVAGRQKPP